MKPLQLFVIRHGETAWSLTGQHTGRTDLALTPRGETMARALQPFMHTLRYTRVLTSPRLRARQTCVLAGFADPDTERDLAEWDYGEYEGQRTAEIRAAHAGWDIWRDGCAGGESPAEVAARADRLIARLVQLEGNVALFTHGQFGRVLAVRWVGWPVTEARCLRFDPACISLLATDAAHGDARVIALWNADPRDGSRADRVQGLSR
jgi:broad specificity phosphatase PhoE